MSASKPTNQGVGVVVHRARLAADRPVETQQAPSRATLNHASHQADHDAGGVGSDGILGNGAALLEHVAGPVDDPLDLVRKHPCAPIWKDRVRAGDLHESRFGRAKCHREKRWDRSPKAEPPREVHDRLRTDLVHHPNRRDVPRLLQCVAQRDRSFVGMVVVLGGVQVLARADIIARRLVWNDRRRGVSLIDRRRVEYTFEE